MNKKEYYKELDEIRFLLSPDGMPFLYETLRIFSAIIQSIQAQESLLLEETDTAKNKRAEVINQIKAVIKKEKGLKLFQIIRQIANIQEKISKISKLQNSQNNEIANPFSDLRRQLDKFQGFYESYMRTYSVTSALSLSIASFELLSGITSRCKLLDSLLPYSSTPYSNENYSTLEIYLSNVTSLKSFSKKLDAIDEIYHELMYLYGLSEQDAPLVVNHLENGSLWLKIAGHTLTAALFTSILTNATNYYQENYTISGQLAQLPRSVSVTNNLLKITEQLEKDGVDVTEIKDNIESSTRKIAKKLDALLGDQPVVEINDNKIDIGESMSNRLIKESQTMRIERNET